MLVKISKTRQNTLLKRRDKIQQKGGERERMLVRRFRSIKYDGFFSINQSKIINRKVYSSTQVHIEHFKEEATNKEYFLLQKLEQYVSDETPIE